MFDTIYLDHNATSPMLPEVADAVREASLQHRGNPESQHAAGREARLVLEDTRLRIGELLGARPGDKVVFTSGGTEANNLALLGLPYTSALRENLATPIGHVITSTIEHPSVVEPARHLETHGWQVSRIGVDPHGVIRIDQVEETLRTETRLVSIMLGNNETGILQPVGELSPLCERRNIPLHTDAAQVVGKMPVDFAKLNVTLLSCAAHKFGGPVGIGALVVRQNFSLRPTLFGGHQQGEIRPGTESVALAVGMCAALESFHRSASERTQRLASLRDELERKISAGLPWALVIGAHSTRLPNTSNIAFVGLDRQALVMAFDLAGIACSAGSACASGSSEPSPTLAAMGLGKDVIEGAVRFSVGTSTTKGEIAEASRRIINVCQRLRNQGNL